MQCVFSILLISKAGLQEKGENGIIRGVAEAVFCCAEIDEALNRGL